MPLKIVLCATLGTHAVGCRRLTYSKKYADSSFMTGSDAVTVVPDVSKDASVFILKAQQPSLLDENEDKAVHRNSPNVTA